MDLCFFCRASGTVYTAIEVATGHEVTTVSSIHLFKGAYHFSELARWIAQLQMELMGQPK